MQSNEVVIKLMSKLERVDKDTSSQQMRSMIEGVLHNYDINTKSLSSYLLSYESLIVKPVIIKSN